VFEGVDLCGGDSRVLREPVGRVAGLKVHQHEADQRDPEHHRDGLQ
jgi:hypothetical protein